MLLAWLLSLLGATVFAYAVFWWYGRRARILLSGLPSYPALPFIGNLHQVLGDAEFLVQSLKNISAIQEDTGLPFVVWIGPRPVIVLAEPEDVKAVTNAFAEKPYYYSFAKEWVGNGLVTAPTEIWKRTIKKLAGTFTGSIVDGYQEVFNAQAEKLVQNLKGEVGKEPFDVMNKYLAYTTLEIICQTALGVPRISASIVTHEYYTAFKRTFELFIQRGCNILCHLDWVYRLTPAYKELKGCIQVLHNVSDTIIKKRLKEREEMERSGASPNNEPEKGKPRFKSFLDIMFEMSELDPIFSIKQIQSEVDTIIVGGQETIATTMFFTLLVLGTRRDVQAKVYEEVKEIFGNSKRPVQKEDLLRMTYSEGVIYETLRLYPPIPFVIRDADRDLELKSCTIPRGTGCGVNTFAAGRSKRAWGPDAEEFRPERWQDTERCQTHPASFLAFSYGKRACIGKRYAMALLKTMLAYCIRELEIRSDIEKLRLKTDVTLKAASGHLITVKLRD